MYHRSLLIYILGGHPACGSVQVSHFPNGARRSASVSDCTLRIAATSKQRLIIQGLPSHTLSMRCFGSPTRPTDTTIILIREASIDQFMHKTCDAHNVAHERIKRHTHTGGVGVQHHRHPVHAALVPQRPNHRATTAHTSNRLDSSTPGNWITQRQGFPHYPLGRAWLVNDRPDLDSLFSARPPSQKSAGQPYPRCRQ